MPQLRVIDEAGEQVGLLDRVAALQAARERDLDLVLVAPKAVPPVAKIIDFKKFLYQEAKKDKEARKGAKRSTSKEVKLSLFIASADLERLLSRGREFLAAGNQLRVNLMLKGREMGKRERAFELIKSFISELGEVNISKEPRLEGRVIRSVVSKRK